MVKSLHRLELPMTQEPEIKRWTAKRKAKLIKQVCHGRITIAEAARQYDLTSRVHTIWYFSRVFSTYAH